MIWFHCIIYDFIPARFTLYLQWFWEAPSELLSFWVAILRERWIWTLKTKHKQKSQNTAHQPTKPCIWSSWVCSHIPFIPALRVAHRASWAYYCLTSIFYICLKMLFMYYIFRLPRCCQKLSMILLLILLPVFGNYSIVIFIWYSTSILGTYFCLIVHDRDGTRSSWGWVELTCHSCVWALAEPRF